MTYPGYLLNPGDLFQVDPERVMFALGASKDASEREASRNLKKRIAKAVPAEGEEATEGTPEPAEPVDPETAEKKARKAHKDSLQALLQDAKDILEDTSSAKKKQRIRAFAATVRRAIGSSRGKELESLDDEVNDLMNKLSIAEKTQKFDDSAVPTDALRSGDPSLTKAKEESAETEEPREHSAEEKRLIRKALQEIRENPIDPSKPYATPWRPRPFLPAFAFVPRYLEVNHNICSAVYLRHPVARPGLAEVPTPFPLNAMGLSYNWYLRRGR